MVTMVWVVGRN